MKNRSMFGYIYLIIGLNLSTAVKANESAAPLSTDDDSWGYTASSRSRLPSPHTSSITIFGGSPRSPRAIMNPTLSLSPKVSKASSSMSNNLSSENADISGSALSSPIVPRVTITSAPVKDSSVTIGRDFFYRSLNLSLLPPKAEREAKNLTKLSQRSNEKEEESSGSVPEAHRRGIGRGWIAARTLDETGSGKAAREIKAIIGSQNTNKIIMVRDPVSKELIVMKFFINRMGYHTERKTIENDKIVISKYNELRKNHLQTELYKNTKVPILVDIKEYVTLPKCGKGVAFLEGAEGKTLKDILLKAEDREARDLIAMFSNIGKQMGNIYLMLNKDNFHQPRNHLSHADLNMGNIMYCEERGLSYWIDLSGIEFDEYDDSGGFNSGSELNNLTFMRDMLGIAVEAHDEAQWALSNNLIPEAKRAMKKAVYIVWAHQAFFKGYKEFFDATREQPLTMEWVLMNNKTKKSEKYYFDTYKEFYEKINNISETYKSLNSENIDLFYGYELVKVKL